MKANRILAAVGMSERVAVARSLEDSGLFPFFSVAESTSAPHTVFGGVDKINLGSNNYLGLADDPRVINAAVEATRSFGTGRTGSRLMNGNSAAHEELEEMFCRFTGMEAALVFSTGYVANLGLLAGLLGSGDTVLVDRDIHASLYDAVAMSGAELLQFRHNNVAHARKRIERTAEDHKPQMLVVDGIYSMRGDAAPLAELADLCDEHGVLLVSDEAHGLGVVGTTGVGAVEAAGVLGRCDLVTYTFSKSLASCGGVVLGPKAIIDYLKIQSRPFVFTAANTPGSVAAATEALRLLMEHPEWPAQTLERAVYLQERLAVEGIAVNRSDAAVLTVPVGGELETLSAWNALYAAGVFTNPVLAPGVPAGGELLRLSVMRTHSDEDLDQAVEAFRVVAPYSYKGSPIPTGATP